MKIHLILSGAAAILCAGALTSAQIAPQGGSAPRPTTQQPRPQASDGPVMTLTGCLYHEDAIPGRSPNVAEKAGVLEDYILADATREEDRLPKGPVAEAGQPDESRPTAGLASGRMYKVTKIDDHRLKELVGKRVAVTGTIKVDKDVRPGERPANFQNLPNIEGTAIREAAGAACPAAPAANR